MQAFTLSIYTICMHLVMYFKVNNINCFKRGNLFSCIFPSVGDISSLKGKISKLWLLVFNLDKIL